MGFHWTLDSRPFEIFIARNLSASSKGRHVVCVSFDIDSLGENQREDVKMHQQFSIGHSVGLPAKVVVWPVTAAGAEAAATGHCRRVTDDPTDARVPG